MHGCQGVLNVAVAAVCLCLQGVQCIAQLSLQAADVSLKVDDCLCGVTCVAKQPKLLLPVTY